jgi:ABC-type oligopeptide transport system substrate-binding subunit
MFTIGYIPHSFPRDPIKVNQAGEHLVLAQVLEPLVTVDSEGTVVSGIASRWSFSADSKSVEFVIDSSKRFQNGKQILASDVAYSITRHLTSRDSQSFHFLQNIESVQVEEEIKISIRLKQPQPAILKALSRSQLGIVPHGWVFDDSSDTPFISSGKYTLVRKGAEWFLSLREDLLDKVPADVIKEWKITFGSPSDSEITLQPIPDYIPLARKGVIESLKRDSRFSGSSYQIEDSFSLAQTAAWWFPRGQNYGDIAFRKIAMGAVRELFERRRAKLRYRKSTGLVPHGVLGCLTDVITFPFHPPSDQTMNIKIMLSAANFKEIFNSDDQLFVEQKYNVKFEVFIEISNWREELEIQKPDVYVIAWLGGFSEPEGFLTVLTSMLRIDFDEYFESAKSTYDKASAELRVKERDRLFQKFNAELVLTEKMVPAWQPPIFSVAKVGLKTERNLLRHNPDLSNVIFQW